jgi:hypothetical protein
MTKRVRLLLTAAVALATTGILIAHPGRHLCRPRPERSRLMSQRLRLLLTAAIGLAATAILVATPAVIYAGITFNALD